MSGALMHGYEDALGVWHPTPPTTRVALLAAMGVDPAAQSAPPAAPVQVIRPHHVHPARRARRGDPGGWHRAAVDTTLPPDLPLGYHTLRPLAGGAAIQLIVSPGHVLGPTPRHANGGGPCNCMPCGRTRVGGSGTWQTSATWPAGRRPPVRRTSSWSTRWGPPSRSSRSNRAPIFPSSRSYRNLLYLRLEEIPGAAALGAELERLATAGRALNQERVIDRDAIFRLKVAALEQLWHGFGGDPAFEQYCQAQGDALTQFATFCTLAEHYGQGWRHWPAAYRHPACPGCGAFCGRAPGARAVAPVGAMAPRRPISPRGRGLACDARSAHWRRSQWR